MLIRFSKCIHLQTSTIEGLARCLRAVWHILILFFCPADLVSDKMKLQVKPAGHRLMLLGPLCWIMCSSPL